MTDIIARSIGTSAEGPIPPQALDAERSVLAAMLLDTEAIGRAVEHIESPVFYRVAHQKIFGGIVALYNRNEKVDLITLSEELRKRGDLEAIGGPPALVQILDYAATSANLDQHLRIVHGKSVLRSLIKATGEIQQECFAGSDETSAILDRAEQLARALLGSQAEVALFKVRSGHLNESEWRRLSNLTGGLYKAPIMIDDTAAPTVLEIRAKCRRLRAEGRLDLVLIDYLQLVR